MELVGMVPFLTANANNDSNDIAEMKSKMDAMQKRQEAMEKRISKMNAMETLERQECKDIFIVTFLVNFQVFFPISIVFNGRWRMCLICTWRCHYSQHFHKHRKYAPPPTISCSFFFGKFGFSYVVAPFYVESWIRPDVHWCRSNDKLSSLSGYIPVCFARPGKLLQRIVVERCAGSSWRHRTLW